MIFFKIRLLYVITTIGKLASREQIRKQINANTQSSEKKGGKKLLRKRERKTHENT
jgi:hypothetical protein